MSVTLDMGSPRGPVPVAGSELLPIKHSHQEALLYPNHGAGKGGVGIFVSTFSRCSVNQLAEAEKVQQARMRRASSTCRASTVASTSASSLLGASFTGSHTVLEAPSTACNTPRDRDPAAREWEKTVRHPRNFQTSARSARIHDVPPASKWSAVSYYEKDPAEIKRHMDIIHLVEQMHCEQKKSEREEERQRHAKWAHEQRETFRRQKLERAAQYLKAGITPGAAYGLQEAQTRPTTVGTAAGTVISTAESLYTTYTIPTRMPASASQLGATLPEDQPAATNIPLPKPSFMKIYDRIQNEGKESIHRKVEAVKRAKEEAARQRTQQQFQKELTELDNFEGYLGTLRRRVQSAMPALRS